MVTLNKFYFIFQRIFFLLLVILTIQGCQSNKEWLKMTPAPTPNEYILTTFNEKQYSWLNEKEKNINWQKTPKLFFDWRKQHKNLSQEEWHGLGCQRGINRFERSYNNYLRNSEKNVSFKKDSEFDYLHFLSVSLVPALCTGDQIYFEKAMSIFKKLASRKAFLNSNFFEEAKKWREFVEKNPNQKKIGINYEDNVMNQVLAYRDTLIGFLVFWNIYGMNSEVINDEEKKQINEWLRKLVIQQELSYAKYPLDCPSYTKLEIQDDWESGTKLTLTQFEECINIGTSRAAVEALWAITSGDKLYGINALNTYIMFLNMLRQDGSHILESVRHREAHYKSVFNVALMVIVAEAIYKSTGYDTYKIERNGLTILDAMKFLSESAVKPELIHKYSLTGLEIQKQFRDQWHWLVINRFDNSDAKSAAIIQLVKSNDEEQLYGKMFTVFSGGDFGDEFGREFYVPILPFTAMYIDKGYTKYATEFVKLRVNERIDKFLNLGFDLSKVKNKFVRILVKPNVYQLKTKSKLLFSGDIRYKRLDRKQDKLKYRVRFEGRLVGGNPLNSSAKWPKLKGTITLEVGEKSVTIMRDFKNLDKSEFPEMEIDWIENARKCGYRETEQFKAYIISNNPEDIKQTVCVLKKAKPILMDGYLTLIHIADDVFSASSLDRDQIVQYLDEPGGKINLNSLSATE